MNGKAARQKALAGIIRSGQPKTQEELVEVLAGFGFSVTQATLSRDLRDLGITKGRDDEGRPVYSAGPRANLKTGWPALKKMLDSFGTGVTRSGNLLVVKTLPGYAQGVAAAIDGLEDKSVLGSVAGDDTILVVVSDDKKGSELEKKLA